MSNLDLCTKRGNRITDKYVTYTIKDLKQLFDQLGLSHPTVKRKLQYCQKLDEYRQKYPEKQIHMYKWSLDDVTKQKSDALLEKKVSYLEKELEKKQLELEEKQMKLDEKDIQMQEINEQLDSYENELEECESEMASCGDKLLIKVNTIESLEKENKKLFNESQLKSQQMEKLKQQIDEVMGELNEVKLKLKNKQDELIKLFNECEEVNGNISKHLKGHEKTVSDLEMQLVQVHSQLTKCENEAKITSNKIGKLLEEKDELLLSLKQKSETITANDIKIRDLEKSLKNDTEKYNQLESDHNILKDHLEKKQLSLESVIKKHVDCEADLTDCKISLQLLQKPYITPSYKHKFQYPTEIE